MKQIWKVGSIRKFPRANCISHKGTLLPAKVSDVSRHARAREEQTPWLSQWQEWIRGGDKREAEAKESDKAIAKQLNSSAFFVSIDGEDPSDAFMKRFDDLPRTIRKSSSEVPDKGVTRQWTNQLERSGLSSMLKSCNGITRIWLMSKPAITVVARVQRESRSQSIEKIVS